MSFRVRRAWLVVIFMSTALRTKPTRNMGPNVIFRYGVLTMNPGEVQLVLDTAALQLR